VELKTGIIFYEGIEEKVLKLSKDMDFEDRVIYSSFNHYTIKKIKELNNKARTGLLYCDGWIGILEYAKKLGVTALHPCSYNLQYENLIEECKKENIRLHVWTVNEGDEMNFLYKNKVDSIITNYPDVARGIRNNL
jgi:glycerophosphoryl diester phosphodiesterase